MPTDHHTTNAPISPFVPRVHSDVADFVAARQLEAELESMLLATREIFGNDARIVLEQDAENDDDLHLLFNSKCFEGADEVLRKEDEWHERSITVAPRAAPFSDSSWTFKNDRLMPRSRAIRQPRPKEKNNRCTGKTTQGLSC